MDISYSLNFLKQFSVHFAYVQSLPLHACQRSKKNVCDSFDGLLEQKKTNYPTHHAQVTDIERQTKSFQRKCF